MDPIAKLSELFNKHYFNYFIKFLNEVGVIAGGSIVYLLNNYVPKTTVGDIDVFINDKNELIDSIKMLQSICPNECKFNYFENYRTSGENEMIYGISVVTAIIENEDVSFQFILQDYKDVLQVLESFDIDYVQCGLHENEIYTTDICKISHINRCINQFSELPLCMNRLLKAHNKGFATPLFGNFVNRVQPCGFDLNSNDLNGNDLYYFIERDKDRNNYRMEDAIVTGIVLKGSPIVEPLKFPDGRETKYGQFKVEFGENVQLCEFICTKIIIKEVYEIHVAIEPIKFGNRTFKRLRNNTGIELTTGESCAVINSYLFNDELYFAVNKVINANVREIKISDNFEIPIVKGYMTNTYDSSHTKNLDSVNKLIKQHREISNKKRNRQGNLSFIKYKAYECFIYYLKKDNETIAIRKACSQMVYDSHKINGDGLCSFLLLSTIDLIKYKNIGEMIYFIEGFN